MQDAIGLDPRKTEEGLQFFSQPACPEVDPVNTAVALVGIEGTADDILKNSTRVLDRLSTPSGDPCLAIVDTQRHDSRTQRSTQTARHWCELGRQKGL